MYAQDSGKTLTVYCDGVVSLIGTVRETAIRNIMSKGNPSYATAVCKALRPRFFMADCPSSVNKRSARHLYSAYMLREAVETGESSGEFSIGFLLYVITDTDAVER